MKTSLTFAAAAFAALLAASPAFAKCTVTLKMTNGNSEHITVLGSDSQSRVNGALLWSKMGFQNTPIKAGETADASFTTALGCSGSAKRDLRFKYESSPNNNIFEELKSNIDLYDGQIVRVTLKH